MSPHSIWNRFDHYISGAVAVLGTAAAIWGLAWVMTTPAWLAMAPAMQRIAAPFLNVQGVLFGLTLAFLANDTWTAHSQARNCVVREADAIRGLMVMLAASGGSAATQREAVRGYAMAAAEEWRSLARCETSAKAARAADLLLSSFTDFEPSDSGGAATHKAMIDHIAELRMNRGIRVGLSRAHVNPLKWLSMAFLGFVTLLSIAAVHAGDPQAALVAMGLFGLAAAPTAAIVLIHGNPFQPPYAVLPLELRTALEEIR